MVIRSPGHGTKQGRGANFTSAEISGLGIRKSAYLTVYILGVRKPSDRAATPLHGCRTGRCTGQALGSGPDSDADPQYTRNVICLLGTSCF